MDLLHRWKHITVAHLKSLNETHSAFLILYTFSHRRDWKNSTIWMEDYNLHMYTYPVQDVS